jgi:alpha-D-ribose 1-methylphosphonate 5-triphosphate synthase subunit PhnH
VSHPIPSPGEARAHETFTALMWALSYPGQPQALPATGRDALLAIAAALIDLETSYYSADPELGALLARSGARSLDERQAAYQFYPTLGEHTLSLLGAAPVGSHAYPDEGATLIVGCSLDVGPTLRLSGPGIATTLQIQIDGLPRGFWALREQACRYPLGWDMFLVAGAQVVGLPRTTRVEVL